MVRVTYPAPAGDHAPPATLRAFFLVLVIGAIILAPSLLLLYWTFRGEPNPELATLVARAET